MNLATKTTAAAFTAVLGLGMMTATATAAPAPQPRPDKIAVQDSPSTASCVAKITQGEGHQLCTVTDTDGVKKIEWENGQGFSFSQSFAGCQSVRQFKNGIVSSGDGVESITVTGCNGIKKTISPS